MRPIAKQFDTYRHEMDMLTDQNSKEYLEMKKKVVEDYIAKKKIPSIVANAYVTSI